MSDTIKPGIATGQVIVRNLFSGYIPAIMKIERESFVDPWPQEWFKAFILSREISWGAYISHTLAGYLIATKGEDSIHIANIAVMEEHRCVGIARLMMERLYEHARWKLIPRITLEVRKSNSPAISFYKQQGFKQTDVNKDYYPDGEDALNFKLDLE